jgi:hypothetical protein
MVPTDGGGNLNLKHNPPRIMNIETLEKDINKFTLSDIAMIIEDDWQEKVHFAARPYLDAMHCLRSVEDHFGLDRGDGIVLYFLGNAQTWRGPVARLVKKELKRRTK